MTPETLISRQAEDLSDLVYEKPATTLPSLISQVEGAEEEWRGSDAGHHFAAALAFLTEVAAAPDRQSVLLASADQQLSAAIAEAG